MRVVSLLPSATEAIALLLGDDACTPSARRAHLVARSHECDFPTDPALAALPALTAPRTRFESPAQIDRDVRAQLASGQSLYTLDEARLAELAPDLIVTQDLCAVCSIDLSTVRQIAARLPRPPRIISLNPETFEGVLDDLLTLGDALNIPDRARDVTTQLRQRVYAAEDFVNPYAHKPSVAFLEWTDPLFIAGHWTPQLIERAGAVHPLNPTVPRPGSGAGAGPVGQTLRAAGKSIAIPPEILAATRPDHLIICPCGVSLDAAIALTHDLARHDWFRNLPAVQNQRVAVVDGNHMFNRPGPRLVDAFEFLVAWLNDRPDIIPAGFPWREPERLAI